MIIVLGENERVYRSKAGYNRRDLKNIESIAKNYLCLVSDSINIYSVVTPIFNYKFLIFILIEG